MKILLIMPEMGMPEIEAAALQVQQSGHEVYPLRGILSEGMIAEQCRPLHQYQCVIWYCHGRAEGLALGPQPPIDIHAAPALILDPEQVAAYMQACGDTLAVVVLAACEGQGVAAQIALGTDAAVIYSDRALLTTRALTACATVIRALHGGVSEALRRARAQGLRIYESNEGNCMVEIPPAAGELRQQARDIAELSKNVAVLAAAYERIVQDIAEIKERQSSTPIGYSALWVLSALNVVALVVFVLWMGAIH